MGMLYNREQERREIDGNLLQGMRGSTRRRLGRRRRRRRRENL
jgi:hypothetical protein